jgi:hypothetical protein
MIGVVERGGTSPVAGADRALGLYPGEGLNHANPRQASAWLNTAREKPSVHFKAFSSVNLVL